MFNKIKPGNYTISHQNAYLKYIKQNKKKQVKKSDNIFISIVIVGIKNLDKCLKYLKKQKYKNCEILLYETKYNKYKTIYNLDEISGEYTLILDSNCIIESNIIYYFVSYLKNKNIDFMYCDNDMLDINNRRCEPSFKPDYSPDTLLSLNYIGFLAFIRSSLIKNINFKNLYDLYLNVFDNEVSVVHIKEVLYHEYYSDYDELETKKAIKNALKRRNIDGTVLKSKNYNGFYIKYKTNNEKVSIIIPIKDNYNDTKNCIDSIYKKTSYDNYEIVLVNNQSTHKKTLDLIKNYEKEYKNFKIINANYKFNYSKINNDVCKNLKTDYVVFLNNDTKVITPNWIELMLGYARQEHIGAVGIKLLYSDKTIQHGGIVIIDTPKNAFSFIPGNMPIWGGRTSVPYNYSAVTAACMMININKFKKVKGFDEKLEIAYNDIDLCLKLLRNNLYNVYLPIVSMYHLESKTRGAEITQKQKNRLKKEEKIFFSKWNYEDKFYNKNYSYKEPFVLEIK